MKAHKPAKEPHDHQAQGLKVATYGRVGEGDWFYLYECEHITNESYGLETVIAVGEHTNLALCRHCWAGVRGAVSEELVKVLFKMPTNLALLEEALADSNEPTYGKLLAARIRDILEGRSSKIDLQALQSEEEHVILAPESQQQSGGRASSVESGTIQQ